MNQWTGAFIVFEGEKTKRQKNLNNETWRMKAAESSHGTIKISGLIQHMNSSIYRLKMIQVYIIYGSLF